MLSLVFIQIQGGTNILEFFWKLYEDEENKWNISCIFHIGSGEKQNMFDDSHFRQG